MKTTRNLFTMFAMAALAAVCGFAQSPEQPTKNPHYDAALAKKLGADQRGMRSYVLAILKTGPKDADIKGKEREDMFKGHFANMGRLADEGKLAVAGPFAKNDKAFRGLFILSVSTIEEALSLVNTDPVVKSGMMVVDLVPWYGSASLMDSNRVHKLISQDGP
jgi:uncharacterized protein YciI